MKKNAIVFCTKLILALFLRFFFSYALYDTKSYVETVTMVNSCYDLEFPKERIQI